MGSNIPQTESILRLQSLHLQDPLNSVLPFTLWFSMCILPFEFTDQNSVKRE